MHTKKIFPRTQETEKIMYMHISFDVLVIPAVKLIKQANIGNSGAV